MKNRIAELLNKYEKYIRNIEWHIEINRPLGSELEKCNQQLEYYRGIIKDLKAFNVHE